METISHETEIPVYDLSMEGHHNFALSCGVFVHNCDPGFHGALTLEFKNMTSYHSIRLFPGDKIGQLVFLGGDSVSADQSYRTKGNYNGQAGVAQIQYRT